MEKPVIIDINNIIEEVFIILDKNTRFAKYILAAKKLFIQQTGLLNEVREEYNSRINCFLNWFLFDWHVPDYPQSCIYKIIISHFSSNFQDNQSFFQLTPHIHSIFELTKLKENLSIIKDIATKKKYVLESSLGMPIGTIFESRVFTIHQLNYMSNYIIPHPHTLKKKIAKILQHYKKNNKSTHELIIFLHNFYTKTLYYKNISKDAIYNLNELL